MLLTGPLSLCNRADGDPLRRWVWAGLLAAAAGCLLLPVLLLPAYCCRSVAAPLMLLPSSSTLVGALKREWGGNGEGAQRNWTRGTGRGDHHMGTLPPTLRSFNGLISQLLVIDTYLEPRDVQVRGGGAWWPHTYCVCIECVCVRACVCVFVCL